ncbi:MAG: hypothetical protein PHR45_00365 [Muribaculaceae bacterium]|nr:hypothetical protein [Muribaculaceae bacterium]
MIIDKLRYDPTSIYREGGLLQSYYFYAINRANNATIKLSSEEKEEMSNFFASNSKYFSHKTTDKTNLVFIIVESMNSHLIDKRINGKPVMPFLNGEAYNSNNLYCKNIDYLPFQDTSISGFLSLTTGLIDVSESEFVISKPENTYPSIIKKMKKKHADLHSVTYVGTKTDFWNQNIVNIAIGCEELYGSMDIISTKEDRWATDREIFDFVISEIPTLKQPFFCAVATIDMHSPYGEIAECNLSFKSSIAGNLQSYYS